jgi:hypothetical protein
MKRKRDTGTKESTEPKTNPRLGKFAEMVEAVLGPRDETKLVRSRVKHLKGKFPPKEVKCDRCEHVRVPRKK